MHALDKQRANSLDDPLKDPQGAYFSMVGQKKRLGQQRSNFLAQTQLDISTTQGVEDILENVMRLQKLFAGSKKTHRRRRTSQDLVTRVDFAN